jgi:hypothetical protein
VSPLEPALDAFVDPLEPMAQTSENFVCNRPIILRDLIQILIWSDKFEQIACI